MQYGGDLAMKILIVKPSSLGDIIHVFPAVELLRRRYPDAEYDWLVHPAFANMLEYSPVPVRRKILFDRKKLEKRNENFFSEKTDRKESCFAAFLPSALLI